MRIGFIKTHEDAKLPQQNNKDFKTGDVGFDLFSVEDISIPAKGSAIVSVGLKLGSITPGYWFRIEPRSGLGFKKGIQPHLGVIDNGYRGDLGVKLYNFSDQEQTIKKGQGVAQFIVYKMNTVMTEWIDESQVQVTNRGEKGFGSSDE